MIKVTMTQERTTKNTVVYKAPKGTAIDTLYVQQDAFKLPGNPVAYVFPALITVTVEENKS